VHTSLSLQLALDSKNIMKAGSIINPQK